MKTDYVRSITEDHGTGLKEHTLYKYVDYDDEPARHLAGRRTNSVHEGEATVGNLRKHLAAALKALEGLAEDKPIPLSKVNRAVDLYEALDDVGYFLPQVEAWCVYREPDAEGDWDRVYCAALTEKQAKELLAEIVRFERAKEKGHPSWEKGSERIVVQKMPCDISDLVHPDMPAKLITRNWS